MDMLYWKRAKTHFDKNYKLIYEYYTESPTAGLNDQLKFCREWYIAKAYMRMVGKNNYDDYKVHYEVLFDKYPNHAEPVYELCQSSPSVQERYDLYKRCLRCTIEIFDSGILEWRALCGLLVESYNLGKYEEAYEMWVKLSKDHTLEKVSNKYIDWIMHVKKCGISSVEKLKETASYAIFRHELQKVHKASAHNSQFDIHFVWVKGHREYSIIQYLAVRCAYDLYISNNMNSNIYIYNNIEPENNEWWELTKKCVTIIHITPPKFINGKNIPYAQHVADIMRVCIIYEFGGIYLDFDLLLIKSIQNLIESLDKNICDVSLERNGTDFSNVIMCKETNNKIWNGLMIAKPHNSFLRRWIREYETKYGNEEGGCWWAGLSVETPMRLYKDDSTDVILLDTHTFLPFGFYDDTIYNETLCKLNDPYPLSYGVHLWETEAEKRGVLPKNKEWFEINNKSIFTYLFGKYVI